jgi:hypothetical protein
MGRAVSITFYAIVNCRIDNIVRGMVETRDHDDLPQEEIARRMERGLRRALNTPPQPHGKNPNSPPAPKAKERPASKGRVHKGKDARIKVKDT